MICKVCKKEVKGLMIEHYQKKHADIYKQFYGGIAERLNRKRPSDSASKAGKKGAEKRWGKERGKK